MSAALWPVATDERLPFRPDVWVVVAGETKDRVLEAATVSDPTSLPGGCGQGTFDGGAFWANLVMQEHGPVQVLSAAALPARLREGVTEPPSVIILTARAQLWLRESDGLRAWVEKGGILLVEQPAGQFVSLSGAQAWHARPSPIPLRIRTVAPEIDTFGSFLSCEPSDVSLSDQARVLLWAEASDGEVREAERAKAQPLLWRVDGPGKGSVLGTSADIGLLLARHVLGWLPEDYAFRPRERQGALAGIPVPSDLTSLASESLGPQARPEATLLMRSLWQAIHTGNPWVDLWPFPQARSGAYVVTHDEEGFGDKSVYMAEAEARLGVRSTYFLLPRPTTVSGAEAMKRHGAELALHWHRGFLGGHEEDRTLGPLILERRAMSLLRQQALVHAMIGAPPPPFTRIHGLQWDPDGDSTFRRLVAAGIALDSSFGPIGDEGPFGFGVTAPFFPLDRAGRLMPILELPFGLQDDESAPYERLKHLIEGGATGHWPVVPIFHVNTMAYKPSIGPVESWLEGFQWAQEQGMWMPTVGEYLAFLRARSTSRIGLQVEQDSHKLGSAPMNAKEGMEASSVLRVVLEQLPPNGTVHLHLPLSQAQSVRFEPETPVGRPGAILAACRLEKDSRIEKTGDFLITPDADVRAIRVIRDAHAAPMPACTFRRQEATAAVH